MSPSLLMMLHLCRKQFLEWIMHSKSELVMRTVYLLYGTEGVMQCAPCLVVCMDISIMVICFRFSQIFKLSCLMCCLKELMLNLMSLWYIFMLKPLALYMFVTVWSSLIIFLQYLKQNFCCEVGDLGLIFMQGRY